MNEPVCMDCWRRDNLTFAQRLDPAFVTPGPVHRCAMHRAQLAEFSGTAALRRFGEPEGTAA